MKTRETAMFLIAAMLIRGLVSGGSRSKNLGGHSGAKISYRKIFLFRENLMNFFFLILVKFFVEDILISFFRA